MTMEFSGGALYASQQPISNPAFNCVPVKMSFKSTPGSANLNAPSACDWPVRPRAVSTGFHSAEVGDGCAAETVAIAIHKNVNERISLMTIFLSWVAVNLD